MLRRFLINDFLILKVILLEETWCEIFLLNALQITIKMEPNPLLSIFVDNDNKNCFKLLDEINVKFKMLNVDANEFTFLKTIILFKSGNLFSI